MSLTGYCNYLKKKKKKKPRTYVIFLLMIVEAQNSKHI